MDYLDWCDQRLEAGKITAEQHASATVIQSGKNKGKRKTFSKLKPDEKFWFVWCLEGFGGSDLVCRHNSDREHVVNGKRFDFVWPDLKVIVEIDGFGFGHQSQQGIATNNDKRNHAVLAGWLVLVFDSRLLGSRLSVRRAVEQTCDLLTKRADQKTKMTIPIGGWIGLEEFDDAS